MVNPNMPQMPNIPGMGAMTDTLEFVKNLWGSMGIPGLQMPHMPGMPSMAMPGMNIPGMVMPTLSVDEINKKVSDLKAVESWLGLNMSMLRSTIQALEVQAATIATLQTMGENFAATMNPMAQERPASAEASPAPHNGAGGGNGSGTSHAEERSHHAAEPTSKDQSDAASLTAPLVNAAAWWNMLQDQFKQAVNTAMTEAVPAAAPESRPKAKAAKKTASSASGTGTTTRKRKTTK